jgi:hypothetical protein
MTPCLRALAVVGGLLPVACGSDPGPEAADTALPAWGAVHVQTPLLRSTDGSILPKSSSIESYAVSRRTGRLVHVGSVSEIAAGGRFVADPQGRFLFLGFAGHLQSYEVNRDGSLSRRADLTFAPYPLAQTYHCGDGRTTALSANGRFLYLVRECSSFNQYWYSLEVLAVAADGGLTVQGSRYLGNRYSAGTGLFADPAGRFLYRHRWVSSLLAEPVLADGLPGTEVAEVTMPQDWGDVGRMQWTGQSLIVTDEDAGEVASLMLDEPGGRLDIRARIPRVDWQSHFFMVPFGPNGFLLGRYRSPPVTGQVYEDVLTRYEVGPQGQLAPIETVPDPDRFYSTAQSDVHSLDLRLMRFHPSGGFAYAATTADGLPRLRAFAAAPNGRLTLLQEIPQATYDMVFTPPLP